MESSFLSILFNLVSVISPLVIFIACCFYISKIVKTDSILLIIGSGVGLLLSLFYVAMPYVMQSANIPVSEVTTYYSIIGVISFLSGICFASGLCMLILDTVKTNAAKTNSPNF